MVNGEYAVLRFVPDLVRDEPINIGIIVVGPGGASLLFHEGVLQRMVELDPYLDSDMVQNVREFISELVERPVLRVSKDRIQTIAPGEPGFLDGSQDQLPTRFVLGRRLCVRFPDGTPASVRAVSSQLLDDLVAPRTSGNPESRVAIR